MKVRTMLNLMMIVVFLIFAITVYIGVPTPQNNEAGATGIKTYNIRVLGEFRGIYRHEFEIQATEFFETWEGGYYRFTKPNGEQVYYPVSRTIVTVKP